jgi:hypothetical protein
MYTVIRVGGAHGGTEWCVFNGEGPPSTSHLLTTNKQLADRVCALMNAAAAFAPEWA